MKSWLVVGKGLGRDWEGIRKGCSPYYRPSTASTAFLPTASGTHVLGFSDQPISFTVHIHINKWGTTMRHPRWIAGGFDEATRNWKLYAAIVEQMKKFYSVSGWWRWQSSVRQISFLCSERKFIHFQIKSMINLFSADTFSHQYFPAYIPFHKYALINNMNIRTRNLAHRWIERLADDQSKTPFLPKWCSTTSLIPIYNTIHFQNYTDFLGDANNLSTSQSSQIESQFSVGTLFNSFFMEK